MYLGVCGRGLPPLQLQLRRGGRTTPRAEIVCCCCFGGGRPPPSLKVQPLLLRGGLTPPAFKHVLLRGGLPSPGGILKCPPHGRVAAAAGEVNPPHGKIS